ncbi:hypothetical protein ACIQH6_05280 [Micromonospora orduensis]|uniref:hypothetical protein n=1 Tax=Micromonospora orduensis TaxID=1420891 RepID=UPI0037FC2A32
MPEQEMVPDTRITAAPVAFSALVSAEALVTVVVAALPPPVVPPFWVAQPTRPVCGGLVGGGVVGGGVVGGGVVVGVVPPVQATLLRVKLVGAGLLEPFQLALKPNEVLPLVARLAL